MNRELKLEITFLGTGTSHGVPMIGCECRVCRSTDPRDARTRPSVLLSLAEKPAEEVAGDAGEGGPAFAAAVRHVLIDAGADLRQQALRHRVTRVDAILFTHSHADHVMGLDEVRRFNVMQHAVIPCFADARTAGDLRRIYSYAFDPPAERGGGIPQVSLFEIGGRFTLGGLDIVPVPLMHGSREILGFRIGDFAYLTDCNAIPAASWPLLEGVEVLVLDALRERPHPTHFTLAEALDVVSRVKPRRAYFTHVCHDLPHAATNARLPEGVELAYDGLVLSPGAC